MPKKNVSQSAYVCCQCNKSFDSLTQFYKAYSSLYAGTGYLPICKDCFAKLFNSYLEKYKDPQKAMKRICMAFDLYYNDSLFDTCNDGTKALIGNYIKRLNMVQYKHKTFTTTLDEGFDFYNINNTSKKNKNSEESERGEAEAEKIDPKDIEKWGCGFQKVDYDILNSHYKFLKKANPNCDSNQEIFITDLCYTKMQQMKAVREGHVDDYNKLTDSYRKTFQQAGLKTIRDESNNADDCWGVFAALVSQYTPEEYYKDKNLYEDNDNIGIEYERHVLRPLRNLEYNSQDRDYEYFVPTNEDEINE